MIKNEMIAMILAGGQGTRLSTLTKPIAKPAVSFGGKYRIIDFTLSNCLHSGVRNVGILTQYKPLELTTHIGNGSSWDLDFNDAGVTILPPYQTRKGNTWYQGTADAIYANLDFLDTYNPEYVLILSGDHIYKMNYQKMLAAHKKNQADLTVAVMEVPFEEASRFGIMNTDENLKITEFEEKPQNPKNNLASMGVYIFSYKKLKKYLLEDAKNNASKHDFGHDIIPRYVDNQDAIFAYVYNGYWRDVGTVESLWHANMDLLNTDESTLELYDSQWGIYSRDRQARPKYFGTEAKVKNSLVSGGAEIYGSIDHSIISTHVIIEKGASVKHTVVLPYAHIKTGAKLEYCIVTRGGIIEKNIVHKGNKDTILLVGEEEDDNE